MSEQDLDKAAFVSIPNEILEMELDSIVRYTHLSWTEGPSREHSSAKTFP